MIRGEPMTRHLFFAALLLCTTSATTTVAVAGRQTKPDDAQREEELASKGKQATDELCTQCHGIEDVTASRRTPREWDDVVKMMMERGASGTDEQVAMVKQYLTRYYGIV